MSSRQPVHEREQRRGVVRRAVGDAHAELDEDRVVDQAVADHLVDHHEVAGVEDLELGPHAEVPDPLRHRPQHRGGVDHDVVAAGGEVHRAAVERADLRAQLLDVHEPVARRRSCPSRRRRRERRVGAAEHEVAAHAGGQVEHDVDVGRAHALDDLAVQRRIARALAGLRVADVDVGDGGAGARGLDRRRRDVLRGRPARCRSRPSCRPRRSPRRSMKTSGFTPGSSCRRSRERDSGRSVKRGRGWRPARAHACGRCAGGRRGEGRRVERSGAASAARRATTSPPLSDEFSSSDPRRQPVACVESLRAVRRAA